MSNLKKIRSEIKDSLDFGNASRVMDDKDFMTRLVELYPSVPSTKLRDIVNSLNEEYQIRRLTRALYHIGAPDAWMVIVVTNEFGTEGVKIMLDEITNIEMPSDPDYDNGHRRPENAETFPEGAEFDPKPIEYCLENGEINSTILIGMSFAYAGEEGAIGALKVIAKWENREWE